MRATYTNIFVYVSEMKSLCVCAELLQLSLTLCDPMDCSPLASSVRGILQARILEWVAIPSFRGSSRPASIQSPAFAGWFFTTTITWDGS